MHPHQPSSPIDRPAKQPGCHWQSPLREPGRSSTARATPTRTGPAIPPPAVTPRCGSSFCDQHQPARRVLSPRAADGRRLPNPTDPATRNPLCSGGAVGGVGGGAFVFGHKKTTLSGGLCFQSSGDNSCPKRLEGNGNVLPGIALFSQGATPQLSLPLLRLTPEFEMDRGGSTAPWTPG